ncbi:MAG TPA: sigma-70 family RNA polymerase sigma factor [Cyclobacteriaceae bacterium]|nr:sigma-70 family RNA polymerase sigma factor [Cyclobacteriaceae bacterium]
MSRRSLPFEISGGFGVDKTFPGLTQQENSEGQIWLEFIRGSDHAIGWIYRAYANKLYNYGRQFTRNENLVLDAVQDVFLGLIKNRKNLGLAVSIKFYLYASLRRNLLRQLKRNEKIILKEKILDEDTFILSIDSNPLSLNPFYSSDQKRIIEQVCNRLPDNQREALVLYYLEGFSYKEIAEIMKLSTVKSVRAMVYRALDSLSDTLSRWKDRL